MVIHVKADSERDLYQTGIGAHVSQSRYSFLSPSSLISCYAQLREEASLNT